MIARSSRISSGRTSRVPDGIGWITAKTSPRRLGVCSGRAEVAGARGCVHVLGRSVGVDALDPRAEVAQALVDALIAAVDLADVLDL